MDINKLKKNIDKLSVSELKMLLESSKPEVINIVVEQLYYLCRDARTDKVANECFELAKDKFTIDQLFYLCVHDKTNKIVNECFGLGKSVKKDVFNIKDYL